MVTLRQTNQQSVTTGSAPLSPLYIMLIRPQVALLLARIYVNVSFSNVFLKYKEV